MRLPLLPWLGLAVASASAAAAAGTGPSSQSRYILVEVSTLTGQAGSIVTDLNNDGDIVGYQPISATRQQPFVWHRGLFQNLPLFAGDHSGQALGINDHGAIVGISGSERYVGVPTLWTGGLPALASPGATGNGIAVGINNHGDIIGRRPKGTTAESLGFVVVNGIESVLPVTGTDTNPIAINDDGMIAGARQNSNSPSAGFILDGTTVKLVDTSLTISSSATAINASGQITGYKTRSNASGFSAFRMSRTDGVWSYDNLDPTDAVSSVGQVIANDGTVFGSVSFTSGATNRAMILAGSDSVDLADLVIGADNAHLDDIIAVNDAGFLLAADVFDPNVDSFAAKQYLLVPRQAATSTFSNLSVRARLTSSTPLIVGTAAMGAARDVLVRAIGPGLSPYVSGATQLAANPNLNVFDATANNLASNDDWASAAPVVAATTQAQAFPLEPASTDAATVVALRGSASVHVEDQGSGGMGLVELYDVTPGTVANRLVNLSARYEVGTGDDVLVAGFIISGTGPKNVLIRGIGPGLTSFGIDGVLADPQISLHDAAGNILATNDDWSTNLGSVFSTAGAFSLDPGSPDAAMVLPLWPGIYSVILRGANGGTGQGLIELYDLDS